MKSLFFKFSNITKSIILMVYLCCNLYSQFPSWNALNGGTNGLVRATINFNDELIVGGQFSIPGMNIARYDGSTWSTFGTGANDTIFAFAIYNGKLIAAGAFTSIDGVPCNRIAQWDGLTWSPLGIGVNNTIFTADSIGNFLMIGGRFTTAGGVNCSHVARWQVTGWSAVGEGVNDNVYAMTQFGDDLILGGAFTLADTLTANKIVSFNLTSEEFSALGSGIDSNNVFALGVFLDNLYAGGDFITLGGITVNRIAIWTGTNWNTLGTGMNGTVRSMFHYGPFSFILGGSFTNAGGVSANNIVSTNGSVFSALGGGISGNPVSINSGTNWQNVLVAAGSFNSSPDSNIVGYGALPLTPALILPPDAISGITVTPTFTWASGTTAYSYKIQIAKDPNFLDITINDSSSLEPEYTVPSATPLMNNTTYFWRVNAKNGLGSSSFSLIRFFTTGFLGIIHSNEIPLRFNLYQNYPNPFNPVTKIKFDLPSSDKNYSLKLAVFNINGEKVADLLNTGYTSGKWEIDFDGTDLSSGVYFYSIEAGPYKQTNKMILIK